MESVQAINDVTGAEDGSCLCASEVMGENPVLFEFIRPDGERMSVRLNGKCDGGPDGVVVLNYAFPLWCSMIGKMIRP